MKNIPTYKLKEIRNRAQKLGIDVLGNYLRRDGMLIKNTELSYLGSGDNGIVCRYQIGKEIYALKIFLCYFLSLNEETYLHMKDLPLQNIVKALELLEREGKKNPSHYDAYLMRYLEEDKKTSILKQDTPFFLENIEHLQNDAFLLACEHICMDDINLPNTILNKEDKMLYISDIDMFYYDEKQEKDKIYRQNCKLLLALIKELLVQYIKKSTFLSQEKKVEFYTFLNFTFGFSTSTEINPLQKVENLFKGCKTPKEFFLRR